MKSHLFAVALIAILIAVGLDPRGLVGKQGDSAANEALFREMLAELKTNDQAAAMLKQLEGEWICIAAFRDGEKLTFMNHDIFFIPDLFVIKDGARQYYYPPAATGHIPLELQSDYTRPDLAVAWHQDLNAIEFRKTVHYRNEGQTEWLSQVGRRLFTIKDGRLVTIFANDRTELPTTTEPQKGNLVFVCKPSDRPFFDFDHLEVEYDINAQSFLQSLGGEWTFTSPDTEEGGPLFPLKGTVQFGDNQLQWHPDPNPQFRNQLYLGVQRDQFDTKAPWKVVAVDLEKKKVFFTVPWKDHVYWFVLFEPDDVPSEMTGQYMQLRLLGTHPQNDPRDLRVIEPPFNNFSFMLHRDKEPDER